MLGGLSEVSLDQRLLRPDGDTIWVTVTFSIQWDAGGRIQSLIGVVEDIDARKRAELELRTQARRQQLLSETMDRLLRVDDPAEVMQDIFASLKTTLDLETFLDYDVVPDNGGIRLSGLVWHSRAGAGAFDIPEVRPSTLWHLGCIAAADHRRSLAILY